MIDINETYQIGKANPVMGPSSVIAVPLSVSVAHRREVIPQVQLTRAARMKGLILTGVDGWGLDELRATFANPTSSHIHLAEIPYLLELRFAVAAAIELECE